MPPASRRHCWPSGYWPPQWAPSRNTAAEDCPSSAAQRATWPLCATGAFFAASEATVACIFASILAIAALPAAGCARRGALLRVPPEPKYTHAGCNSAFRPCLFVQASAPSARKGRCLHGLWPHDAPLAAACVAQRMSEAETTADYLLFVHCALPVPFCVQVQVGGIYDACACPPSGFFGGRGWR